MRLRELTVADLMSVALVTAHLDESVRRADLSMRYADIRHLPVLDQHGRLVGMLPDRDLLRAFARTHRRTRVRVGEVMTHRVRTVGPGTSAGAAAGLLLDHRIGALAVVDRPRHLIGLVTETDFLRVFRLVAERSNHRGDRLEANHGRDTRKAKIRAGAQPTAAAHVARRDRAGPAPGRHGRAR